MKSLLLISITAAFSAFFFRISEINKLIAEGEKAYQDQDFARASASYLQLVEEYHEKDEEILLNLAQSLFQNQEYEKSAEVYNNLSESGNPSIRSLALNQSGIITYITGKDKEALSLFKQSIIESPSNLTAVYNYELLKVSRKENESVNFKNQQLIESALEKKDIDKGGNAKEELLPGKKNEKGSRSIKGNEGLRESDNNSNQNQDREKNDNGKDETLELKSVNKEKETMSKEKALKILDAMQKEEIIYLQQLQRKPENKEDSGEY